MKVFVTGGNGLLGSYIVRELEKRGYDVCVMVREGSDLTALEGTNAEILKGEITRKNDVEKATEGCDVVIHAAAKTTPMLSGIESFKLPNITSTRYLINACRKFGVRRFIFVSTANCFGNGSADNPGDEERPFISWYRKSGYAYSKYLAQKMVLRETIAGNPDAVVVNPTFIIGAKNTDRSSGQIFSYILNKRISFYPPGGKNFVDAEAAASGIVNAIRLGKAGECYLLAGDNLSYKNFFKMVSEITGQKTLFIPVPCFFIKLVGFLGDLSEKIFKKPVQLNSVNARMLCMDNYYTPAKAMKELEFPFIPAEVSVRKALCRE
jgi:dihydroflavonol-4-reductase